MKHKDKEIRAKYLKFANVLADIDRTTQKDFQLHMNMYVNLKVCCMQSSMTMGLSTRRNVIMAI